MKTIDEAIEEAGREVGRRLMGCTLSPKQYDRLISIIREDVWPAVHHGVSDDNPLPGSFTFQCGTGEMGTLHWSKPEPIMDPIVPEKVNDSELPL